MKVIYRREGGGKIVLDRIDGNDIYAHIVDEQGKAYPPKLLDNLLSHGYWEPVEDK